MANTETFIVIAQDNGRAYLVQVQELETQPQTKVRHQTLASEILHLAGIE